jgi:hypothetical protein
MQTVLRRWRLATWLVAGSDARIGGIESALGDADADVVLLQSVRRSELRRLAAGLEMSHVWAFSHHPRSRLFPSSAVGLAVLTPHRITEESSVVVNAHRSKWSRERRVGQFATVERRDHSAYRFGHAAGVAELQHERDGPPFVQVHPIRIEGDPALAVELPQGAVLVALDTKRPFIHSAQLLTIEFDVPWVAGDLAI